ncbi:hypothetical protein BJX76DRAFT_327810 [Aspergillus varians]
MEADKIKKKLNGSILKGRKFKVESARPQKVDMDGGGGQDTASNDKPSSTKKSKKRKAEDNVLGGYELPPDRKSKKQSKKNKASSESVVHEFSQTTTYPAFLRSDAGANTLTSTFEEGKGWVDESGNLKEPASDKIRKDQYRPGQIAGHKEKPKQAKAESATKAKNSTKDKSKRNNIERKEAESTESEDWTSSSGSSSESDTTNSEDDDSVSSSSSEESELSDVDSSLEPEALSKEKAINANPQQQPTEVHPLEALFKKATDQKKPDSDPPAQFSFFGQEDADSEEETPANIAPLTPFTKRITQDRDLRSAAPTPDTSQVTRTINWNPPDHSDDIGETHLDTDSPVPKSGTGSKDESDFAKWFWENRGDNNRAWKKRRRDAAKEQRQRDNRRKGMKGKS